jgi:hypothetical protein
VSRGAFRFGTDCLDHSTLVALVQAECMCSGHSSSGVLSSACDTGDRVCLIALLLENVREMEE